MSRKREVIYKIIPVGVVRELYLFPEMETDCFRTFFVRFTKVWYN